MNTFPVVQSGSGVSQLNLEGYISDKKENFSFQLLTTIKFGYSQRAELFPYVFIER